MRIGLLLLLGIFSVQTATAQVFSNEFLSVGAGARAQAMGNATVASSTDAFSSYWNPAGLVGIDSTTGLLIGAIHAEQFAGATNYDFIGLSLPFKGNRRLGLSLVRQGTDDIPNTLFLVEPDGTINYDNISSFAVADYAALISYAQPTRFLNGNLSVGGNLKIIRRIIGDFSSAWGVGVDLGARYVKGKLSAGIMLRDVTSTYNAWSTTLSDEEREVLIRTGNSLPDVNGTEITRPSLLPAVAYRFEFGQFGVAPELAAWLTFDGQRNTLISADPVSMDLNFGLEADFKRMVFLRLGADQWQRYAPLGEEERLGMRPALGLGLALKRARLDYAFSNPGDGEDLYAHVLSLQVGLQRPELSRN